MICQTRSESRVNLMQRINYCVRWTGFPSFFQFRPIRKTLPLATHFFLSRRRWCQRQSCQRLPAPVDHPVSPRKVVSAPGASGGRGFFFILKNDLISIPVANRRPRGSMDSSPSSVPDSDPAKGDPLASTQAES